MRRSSFFVFALLLLAAWSGRSFGQEILFQTSFDDDTGMIALADDDAEAEFNYEYLDFDGIPEAPNSDAVDGDPNRGLRLSANIQAGAISAVAVATEDLNLSLIHI